MSRPTPFDQLSLPDSWDVGYAYSPRENTGSGGGYHIIVGEDFKAGRIVRRKGDTLCKRQFWGLDGGRKKLGVTCKRCLQVANSVVKYPLTDEQRAAQANQHKPEVAS